MDRPIKSKGKYNLHFIDWQNQHQVILNNADDKQSPIYGMSDQEYQALMLQDSMQIEIQNNIQEELQQHFDINTVKKMRVGKTNKQCTVCLKQFEQKQIIRVLKCSHIFHDQCIVPWFKKSRVCPNCREVQ